MVIDRNQNGGGPGKGYDWFQSEHGITIDAKGFVWLGGNGANDGQVLKFTQQGAFLLQIGHPATGAASNDVTRLGRPAGVAVDAGLTQIAPVVVRPMSAGSPSREVVVAWRAGSSRGAEARLLAEVLKSA